MLRPEFNIEDICFLANLLLIYVTMYISYRAGKSDGFYEGCRARRRAQRQLRRMRFN